MPASQSFARAAPSAVYRYGLAVLSVAAALGIALTLRHYDLPHQFASFSLAAIAITFWFMGTGPGVLAVILSTAVSIHFFVLPSRGAASVSALPYLITYLVLAGVTGWFSASRRRAERMLRQARSELEVKVEERTAKLSRANEELQSEITERARTEGKLRKQNELLQKIFDHVPVMLSFFDEGGRFKLANREWEQVLGWTQKEVMEQNLDIMAEAYPDPEYRRKVREFIAAADGEWVDFKVRARDGRVIDTAWSRVKLSDGTSIGIGQEITGRKLAEEALKLFRSLIDQSSDAIEVIDPNTLRFLDCNENAYQTLGYTREEFLSLSVRDIDPTIDLARRMWIEREMERAGFVVFESVHLRKDGSSLPVEVNVKLVRLERDYRLAVVRDITERKRNEAALKQSEQDYRRLFEQAHDAILVFVPEREIVLDVNERACELYGFSRPEFIGMSLEAISADVERGMVKVRETLELEAGKRLNFETRQYRKDGTELILEVTASAVRYKGQAAILTINRDITERKHDEQMLQTFPRRLIEAQEAERRRVARELHDEIGQALTAVKITLQNVQYSAGGVTPGPRWNESMEIIDHALQRVRDLSLDLRPSLLDDLGLVAALRWYMDREARRAGLISEFDAELSATRLPPELETACFRIAQEALTNVVRHARARRVWVGLRQRGAELRLLIRDDGIGFGARAVRERRAADTSLGLQGMQERALILGGNIEIKSTPGRGSEVQACFPLAPPRPSEDSNS